MLGDEKVPKPSSVNSTAEPFATVKRVAMPEIGVVNAVTPDRSPVPLPVPLPVPWPVPWPVAWPWLGRCRGSASRPGRPR